jgi:hypothetical protein
MAACEKFVLCFEESVVVVVVVVVVSWLCVLFLVFLVFMYVLYFTVLSFFFVICHLAVETARK